MTDPTRPSSPAFDIAALRAAAELALSCSAAEQTEVLLSQTQAATTRFATDGITQNVVAAESSLTIRALVGQKSGRATTTSFAEADVRRAAASALEAARAATDDPEALALPTPAVGGPPIADDLDPSAMLDTPHARAGRVAAAVNKVRGAQLRPAGTASTLASIEAVANSRGLFLAHRQSQASFALTALSDTSSGWAERIARSPANLEPERVTTTAIDKAIRSRDPKPLEPGDYTVVLEPAALADLLLFLGHCGFSGLACNEGRSYFSERQGETVLSPAVTIWDDVHHPLSFGAPFDAEGSPRRTVTLIDQGRFVGPVHDRRTARAAGTDSTGHALPQPSTEGPLPLNLVMKEGNATLAELIHSTRKGILVSRLHYTNVVDPKHLLLTGMTRDGTFLIENGRLTSPIQNLRFTESAVRILSHVDGVTSERSYHGALFGGGFVVPGLKTTAFAFSSATRF